MLGKLTRILRHLSFMPWRLRRMLPAHTRSAIARAIRDAERGNSGEIRLAVEAAFDGWRLLRGQTARQRAWEVFAQLGVWDTEYNNGVLIYILLADHSVEIVADRGIDRLVGREGWRAICEEMETQMRAGDFEAGILAGVAAVGRELARHFGGVDVRGNELPNRPVIV